MLSGLVGYTACQMGSGDTIRKKFKPNKSSGVKWLMLCSRNCCLGWAPSRIRTSKKFKIRLSVNFAFSKKCNLSKLQTKSAFAFFEKCDLSKLQTKSAIAFFEKCECTPKCSCAFFSHFFRFFAFLQKKCEKNAKKVQKKCALKNYIFAP